MTMQVGKALNNETESAPRARSQFHFSSFAFGHKSQSNVKCLCSFRSPIEVFIVARRVPGHRIPCNISVHEFM